MSLKLIGALLIFAGCGGMGLSMAHQSKKEELLLRQTVLVLEYMSCELQYHLTALPELFLGAAKTVSGEMREVLVAIAGALETQLYTDAAICMRQILHQHSHLPGRVAKVLEQLAASLGIFDLPGQIAGLESTQKACEKELNYLERNREERMRSYRTLGFCAGAALAILLF